VGFGNSRPWDFGGFGFKLTLGLFLCILGFHHRDEFILGDGGQITPLNTPLQTDIEIRATYTYHCMSVQI